ncbi:MAG: elongation factor G [Pirellulaceae bacterium]|nr:elongation factor G [Pirellulaceae bacterium]
MGNVDKIRNLVLCGHGGCGKTTLADSFLMMTGAVNGNHSVDDGTSVCDFDPEEKKHKYSIEAASTHFTHDNCNFNVIDTPGYPDFIGQVAGAMRAVENALIVINAHSGIQVNTRRVFRMAGEAGLGRMIVINKVDDENLDFPKLVANIEEIFGSQCVLLNVPIGVGANFKGLISTLKPPSDTSGAAVDPKPISDRLIECIVEVDDEAMERYFEGQVPSDEEIHRLIVEAVKAGTLVPIVCCSAKNRIGLKEILDAMVLCGLSPNDLPRNFGDGDNQLLVGPESNGLVAQVFRTRIDPFVQKLSFIRVFSGQLKRDDSVHASSARKNLKMGALLKVQGEHTSPVEVAGPGDIVAVAKMEDLHTSTCLGDVAIPPIGFPRPMVGLAVAPKTRGDETKLSSALHKVVEEDSTFHLDRDPQTKELVITGMSELHLTVIQERLLRRDKLEVETKPPRIAFRETITGKGEGSYRHKKQSGGRGQFGEVHIRMQPLPRGTDIPKFVVKDNFHSMKEYHYDEKSNFLWVDSIVGGTIPGNFLPAIGKGFAERIASGVVAGYPVQDLCIEVHFGKYHDVDSSEAAFKTAARQVFKQVFLEARPVLLEPIVKMEVTVPEKNVGDIFSDMSSRNGRVSGSDSVGGGMTAVYCEVPLREVTTYARTLSSITGGMGSFTMEFHHYDTMPGNIQQEVIAKANLKDDEEE